MGQNEFAGRNIAWGAGGRVGGAELGWALGVTSDQAEEANTDKTTVLLADFA